MDVDNMWPPGVTLRRMCLIQCPVESHHHSDCDCVQFQGMSSSNFCQHWIAINSDDLAQNINNNLNIYLIFLFCAVTFAQSTPNSNCLKFVVYLPLETMTPSTPSSANCLPPCDHSLLVQLPFRTQCKTASALTTGWIIDGPTWINVLISRV